MPDAPSTTIRGNATCALGRRRCAEQPHAAKLITALLHTPIWVYSPHERDSARGREPLRGNSGRVGWSGSRRAAYRRKGKDALTKLVMLARIGARLAVLTIVVLSAVPGKMRSRVLGNDYCEHFRSVSGSLLATGYLRPCRCCRAACSPYAPAYWRSFNCGVGRIASAGGFAAITFGAWIGLLIMVVVRRAHERKFIASYK